MAPGKSPRGGGKQPPNKRSKMETNSPPPESTNSSNIEADFQGPLHSSQPGSISTVMRVQTEHLKCTACLEYPRKEVYQCVEGHLVCDGCIPKITRCPVCRVNYYPYMNIRNRVAETDLEDMTYNCSYRNYGCMKTNIPRNRRNAHDIQCSHNPTATGVKYGRLFDAKEVCQLRICPESITQDPEHAKDVLEHLTVTHNLPHQKVKIGEKTEIEFRLPTIASNEPNFQPVKLFEVVEGTANKTMGYYLLIRRVENPRRKILSWAVVGFNSAPEDDGDPHGGKITFKLSIKANTDPDKVAKDGDECVSNLNWTVKSMGLNEWTMFMMIPSDHRPQSSFSLPLTFLSEFYVQQDHMCELSVSCGPLAN